MTSLQVKCMQPGGMVLFNILHSAFCNLAFAICS